MKKSILAILVIAVVAFIGIFFYLRIVQNPELRWKVSPDYSENGDGVYGPRDQRYKPGGEGSYPDNGKEHKDGKSYGQVNFGPIISGGMGHASSVATTEFKCGDGTKCIVKVNIGSGFPYKASQYEFMKITAQRISSNGSSIGKAVSIKPHAGNSTSKEYTLELDGCGKVRVTAEFDEKVGEDNPSGIQSKFTVQISSYQCM